MITDADYAEIKRRLSQDTLSVRQLHVQGDADANRFTPRWPLQVGTGAYLYSGSGVPPATLGHNGDYYLRSGTPGSANQRLYVKSAGAWVGIV